MGTPPNAPNYQRLKAIQWTAVLAGLATLVGSIVSMDVIAKPELVTIVLTIAFSGIAFSTVFYFGCLFFEGSLQKYILDDDTVIKGERVEMVTTTAASGDDKIDDWVARYVFARNLFGLSIIPLLILGGLYVFA